MSLCAIDGGCSHEHRPADFGIADDGNVEFFPVPTMGSLIQFQSAVAPLLKFTST